MSPGMNIDSPLLYVSEYMRVYLCICECVYRYVYMCVLVYEWGGYVYVCAYVWV